jgi:hypothetical protein
VEAAAPKVAVVTAAESAAEAQPPIEDEAQEPAAPASKPKLGSAAKKPRASAAPPLHATSAVVKPKEKSYTSDFKSKFGSRK